MTFMALQTNKIKITYKQTAAGITYTLTSLILTVQ